MTAVSPEAFLTEVLALPRGPRDARPIAPDLAAAAAWVAGAEVPRVRAILARFPVSEDETVLEAITPRILEPLYEAVGWDAGASPFVTRKAQGSFHTPLELVDRMLTDALDAFLEGHPDPVRALAAVRVVDPSVGPGAFLVGAARALRARRLQHGLSPEIPAGALCGVDVSPFAVEVCRLRLALSGVREPDLHVGDTLVDSDTFRWSDAFPDGFDIVVGNPPYLRDSRRKNLDAAVLKRTYRAATSHYDLYVLFMERSLHIARDGGVVCLLTSNRWLAQKYGRGIRGLLCEHRLRGILDLRFRIFDDAAVQTSITLVQKQPPPPQARTVLAAVDRVEQMGSLLDATRSTVAQAELDERPFRFHVERDEQAIGEQMRARGETLAELAFVTLGMVFHDPRPGGRRKADFLNPLPTGRFRCALLDGLHVDRWQADGGLWLDYQPAEHREPRFPELFAAGKVLCRRIIGRDVIRAMVDEQGRWFSDNVVGVVPYHAIASASSRTVRRWCSAERVARSRRIDLHYLAAVLNSRLITWYHRTFIGFGMHLYPEHLKQMPIVVASDAHQTELADLARAAADPMRRASAQVAIDRLVEELYGLSSEDGARLFGSLPDT